jgi:hypothetical protein
VGIDSIIEKLRKIRDKIRNDNSPSYQRFGSHVTVGPEKPLPPITPIVSTKLN